MTDSYCGNPNCDHGYVITRRDENGTVLANEACEDCADLEKLVQQVLQALAHATGANQEVGFRVYRSGIWRIEQLMESGRYYEQEGDTREPSGVLYGSVSKRRRTGGY